MGRLAVLAVVVACACGGHLANTADAPGDTAGGDAGPDPNDGARSGSRLKIVWYAFTDGTRTWNGLYDAERKENCFIYPWSDGNAYCVPASTGGSIVFGNSQCTQAAIQVYVDPSCSSTPPPSYAVTYLNSACTFAAQHLYTRGAATALAQYYVQNSNGTCAGPYATQSYYHYYALGPEVAPTQLAQLVLSAPAATTRLSERYYASSDGARFPQGAHDAVLGTDCYVESFASTSAICAPETNAYAYEFHDTMCMQPVYGETAGCPAPRQIGYYSPRACPTDPPTFYASGSTIGGSPLFYASSPTQCTSTTASTGTTYYQTGAQLQLATLARAPDALAGHRIQLIHDTAEGLVSRDYALWDSQQMTECYPSTATDGATRCLPSAAFVTSLYSDSACRVPLNLVDLPGGPASCGAPKPPRFAAKFLSSGCTSSIEPHPIGGAFGGTAYANYGTCTAYVPSGKLFSVGAATAATAWESATLVTDP